MSSRVREWIFPPGIQLIHWPSCEIVFSAVHPYHRRQWRREYVYLSWYQTVFSSAHFAPWADPAVNKRPVTGFFWTAHIRLCQTKTPGPKKICLTPQGPYQTLPPQAYDAPFALGRSAAEEGRLKSDATHLNPPADSVHMQ